MIPIIIVNWNGIGDTKECIASVQQLEGIDYQIHLIDNGSEEEQVEELVKLYGNDDGVSLHLYPSNIGFAKAHIKIYEEVLSEESCQYIALLNNDTIVDPNWLTEMVQLAEKESAHLISSKMISYFNRELVDNTGHKMLNTGEILPIGHGEHIDNHAQKIENLGSCAGACLYSKKMIEEIGFFDSYFSTGYEDAEFGLRAIIAGYKAVYAPNALVYHKMGQSIKKIFNFEYSAMIQTSILYSYFKNIPTLKLLLDIPFIILKNILMVIINILFWRIKYLKVQIKSWVTILSSFRTIRLKRKETRALRKRSISTLELFRRTEFFLAFDIKRFYRIIIKKEESAIDNY